MQTSSLTRSLSSSQPHGDSLSISNNEANISKPASVQRAQSLYTTILNQNRVHAHNPNYKTYAQIMNYAESFKHLKPGEKHHHFEDKPSPWLHLPPSWSPRRSPRLNPISRI